RTRLTPILSAVLAASTPVLLILLLIPSPATQSAPIVSWSPFDPARKLGMLVGGMHGYLVWADAAAGLTLAAILTIAAARRRLRWHFGLLLLAAGLALTALAMPYRIGAAWSVDRRLPIMALLTFLAA